MNLNILLSVAGDVFSSLENAAKKLAVEFYKEKSEEAVVVPPSSSGQELVTRFELLEKLKISETTLWNWQNKGWVKPKKIGRKVFFDLNEVMKQKEVIRVSRLNINKNDRRANS